MEVPVGHIDQCWDKAVKRISALMQVGSKDGPLKCLCLPRGLPFGGKSYIGDVPLVE